MTRAFGIDISKWQGIYDEDTGWHPAFEFQNNADFVIIKATEGLAQDPLFEPHLEEVMKAPRRGCYHYFRTEVDPIRQAEYFHEKTAGFHFLAVDYEKTHNTIDDYSAYAYYVCLERLSELTNKPVVIYTSPYLYRDNLIHNYIELLDYPLWMAWYGDGVNLPDYENGTPLFAKDWKIWQYTSSGDGAEYGVASKRIDLDVFNGTIEEMDTWLGLTNDDGDITNELSKLLESIVSTQESFSDELTEMTNNYVEVSLAVRVLAKKLKTLEQGQMELAENGLGYENSIESITAYCRGLDEGLVDLEEDADKFVGEVSDEIDRLDNRIDGLQGGHNHWWLRLFK